MSLTWTPDVLGGGFEAATVPLASGPGAELVATLVRLLPGDAARRALLYVHGFNDYFFQQDLARWWAALGFAFYAVDLRRHGRSLRPGQLPNYCTSLTDYDEELDAAVAAIRAGGHERLVLAGHSTGGLTVPLWAARRPGLPVDGVVLNSPFLEFKQPAALRAVVRPAVAVVGPRQPERVLPTGVDAMYGESLHSSRRGEWDYDLAWKPSPAFPIRLGWLAAVVEGHRRLHAGLDLRAPVLVMSSTRTVTTREWTDDLWRGDAVLDAGLIARWAPALGRHVTVVRVEDGMHDLFLSRRPARDRAYETMGAWFEAWVR